MEGILPRPRSQSGPYGQTCARDVGMKIVLLITVLAAMTACAFIGGDDEETTLQCANCRDAEVERVFDGDTLITTSDRVIRLYGVDAPEGEERCASKAAERLRELAGGTIRLEDGPSRTDELGRTTAYVYTQDGASVDEILIREGLATASTGAGQHRGFLANLELEAKTKDAGCLWQ